MATRVVRDPTRGVYPSTPDFVHGLELTCFERLLYVSGTMGLDQNGVAGADLETQLTLIWRNVEAILNDAGMSLDNVVRVTSYLSDRSQAEANAVARMRALGGRAVPTTAVICQLLSEDWLVEVEVIAAA